MGIICIKAPGTVISELLSSLIYPKIFMVHTPSAPKTLFRRFSHRWTALPLLTLLLSSSALAADPFRTGPKARPMGPALEKAFEDFFRNGSYLNSSQKLNAAQAENPNEPLVYTLQAALAYMNKQPERMQAMAQKTRQVAEAMSAKDEARSHLYRGLATGLEGAGDYLKNGDSALPSILTKVPSMLLEIDTAHKKAPDDPEVNLIVGYVDTVIAKYGLSNYDEALESFRKANPAYLSFRGKALVYREKKDFGQAQQMVDKALAAAPQNPDLFYLKGQILASQRNPTDAVLSFEKALSLGKQLPESTKKQIRKERDTQIAKLSPAVNGPKSVKSTTKS
jgi:tetratricopeptide (TPR) repeat protein